MNISNDSHSGSSDRQAGHGHHVTPTRTLATTLLGLLSLTALTVWAARVDFADFNEQFSLLQVDLHFLNIVIAMGIACLKTALVIAFFMGIKYDKPFTTIVFFSGFLFLGVFIIYTLSDTLFRGAVYERDALTIPFESPVKVDTGSVRGHGASH